MKGQKVAKPKIRKFAGLNKIAARFGIHLSDASVSAAEQARLARFEARGGLDAPAYALSPGMDDFDLSELMADYDRFQGDLARLKDPEVCQTGYVTPNGYYDSPDSDALYLMVRRFQPERIIEVGCGNSTRVSRQALLDGQIDCKLTAIDPYPRADIAHVVDAFEQKPLEDVEPEVFDTLQTGDILFIDSSHQLRMSNDVAHLFCRIIPRLATGVVIHVHDVFLPFEYPKRFFYDCPSWAEQYVLHALIQSGGYEVLWPGYYLQQARPDAAEALPFLRDGRAQSFWIRKT